MTTTRNVLIVDGDLGFVFWLGRALDEAGYQALPAKSIADATALLDELSIGIDLLIVNYSLPGAAAFSETLRQSQGRNLRVIALAEEWEESGAALASADVLGRKPGSGVGLASRMEWVETIQGVFAPLP